MHLNFVFLTTESWQVEQILMHSVWRTFTHIIPVIITKITKEFMMLENKQKNLDY